MSKIRLILGLEFKRFFNQFRFAKSQRKGMRLATSTKKKGGWLLPALMTLGFFCMILFYFKMGTERLIVQSYPEEVGDVIVVSDKDHFGVSSWARVNSGEERSKEVIKKALLESIFIDFTEEAAEKYTDHLITHGEEGFISAKELKNKLKLSDFASADLQNLATKLGVVLSGFCLFLVLSPIAMRYKDLAAEDTQLEMLFGLPLENKTILAGRFLAMWIVRPTTMFIFGCLLMFYINASLGLVSLPYAVVGALSLAAVAAGIELCVETVLRSKGTQKVKKNVQVFCLIVGTMGMYLGISMMISQQSTIMDWMVNSRYGDVVYYLGAVFLLPVETGLGGLIMLGVVLALAVLVTFISVTFSAKSLKSGLSAGGGMHASRGLKAKEMNLSVKDSEKGKPASSLKYEWLIILRDRALLTQLLVVPLMILLYNWMMNPQFLEELSLLTVCMVAYGVAIFGVMTSAGYLVASEMKSLWVIFTLPIPVAEFFRRRAVLWGLMLTALAALVMCSMVVIFSIELDENIWRAVACIPGVYILSRLNYAIILGKIDLPDPASGQMIKLSFWRVYLCMGLGGVCGYSLYQGSPWNVFACFTIIWFLGDSLWANLSSRLRYIFETIHDVPLLARLSDALKMILIYFIIQSVFFMIFTAIWGEIGLLISFIAAGVVTVLICLTNEKFENVPKIGEYSSENLKDSGFLIPNLSPVMALIACFLVTSAVAVIWLELMKVIPFLSEQIPNPEAMSGWYLFILIVFAAPLIEEFIFRKMLFRVMLQEWTLKKSIICSSLIFAVIHPGLSFPPVFLLGVATAWIYVKSGKLRYSIILHGAYNAVVYLVQVDW